MSLGVVLKPLHVAAAIWFISGLLGRNIVLAQARKTKDIHILEPLIQLAGVFDNLMVVRGAEVVLVLGLITAWAEGYPVLGFVQGAQSNWVLVSLLLFLSTIPLVVFIFLPRGKVFDRAFKTAAASNQFTPELETALDDPWVSAAHTYELVIIAVVLILMVVKPF